MQPRGRQRGSLRQSSTKALGGVRAFLCHALLAVLMVQLALPPQLWAQNSTPAAASWRPHLSPAVATALEDPLLKTLQDNRANIERLGRAQRAALEGLRGSADLDEDPFFLRSQRWLPLNAGEAAPGTGAVLDYPLLRKRLHITAPGLRTLLTTDDYTFLTTASDEGLFVIDTMEALQSASDERPVPVFFMPLPGKPRRARILATQEVIVLALAGGTPLPVLLADITLVTQAGRLNLALTQIQQIEARLQRGTLMAPESLAALASFTQDGQPQALTRLIETLTRTDGEAGPLLPAPGSTAGNGILFTGFGATASPPAAPSLHTRTLQKIWDALTIPSAHAVMEISGAATAASLLSHFTYFVGVSTVALIASVVLKYTVLKGKIAEKRRCRDLLEASQPTGKTPPRSWLARGIRAAEKTTIGREVVEIGDVYAHTLTTLYQFPGVTFGNVLEYAADRFFPKQAGPKKPLRRLLENTALFVRDTMSGIPVNTMTWVMGAVVLGGIDTALYYLQLYHLVPTIALWIAQNVPGLRELFEEAYAIGNPHTEILNRFALFNCIVSYYNAGASSLSQDIQGQFIGAIRAAVDDDLRRMGLNPDSADVHAERERRVRDRMDASLRRMGLPGPESFLFDAQSLHEGAMRIVGYGGRDRPGLLAPSLNAAIKEARRRGATDALRVLEETKRELSFLRQFTANPTAILLNNGFQTVTTTVRRARQHLVALSAEGNEAEILAQALPAEWAERVGEAGARLAAQLFRGAYLAHFSGDERHLTASGDGAIIEAPSYEAPRHGLIARWQLRRITRRSMERFIAATGAPFGEESATRGERALFLELFSQEYLREVGIHPDQEPEAADLNGRIHAAASEATLTQLSADAGLRAHIATLDPAARQRLENELYAENLVQAYVNSTWLSEAVPPLSPSQPGVMQRVRQWGPVRRSAAATRALRTFEALFGDSSYHLGLGSALERTLPAWADFKLSNSRAYRGAITGFFAVYPFTALFWGVSISPALWALQLVGRFTITAPSQYLNRLFRMQGMKPMSNVPSMVLFAVIYSFASFWGSIPMQIFAGDFEAGWNAAWAAVSTPFILLRRFFFGG